MSALRSWSTLLSLALVAGCQVKNAAAPSPSTPPPINPNVACNVTPQGTPITPALLTSGLPCDVEAVAPFDLDHLQDAFDFYSWLTFIALNASAPNTAPRPENDAQTLWEDYKDIADIFLPGGKTPAPWDAPNIIPPVCQNIEGANSMRIVRRFSLRKAVTSETGEPFDTGPLIDQNGNYVRYQILVNQPMFEFIVQNNLYSQVGQSAFNETIDFPEGDPPQTGDQGPMGAIMVKVAWKVIGPNDDPSKFHISHALAYNPPSENPKVAESCEPVTLGLVGWHAAHKTAAAPQWIWSTFEHVDNVPTDADIAMKQLKPAYNFYNPACHPSDCPINEPPPRPWDPNVQPFPNGFKSQITRVVPVTDATISLNQQFQGILAGTVWPNYELISTQWPTDPQSQVDLTGVPAPDFLANTTLETYIQGMVPKSSSSCMDCHKAATDTTGKPSDFTFTLERAQ